MSNDRENRIRQRAYQLWEDDGAPKQHAEDYWHKAVAQIDAETAEPDEATRASTTQTEKRRIAGDPLQEDGAVPAAETAREKRRG